MLLLIFYLYSDFYQIIIHGVINSLFGGDDKNK